MTIDGSFSWFLCNKFSILDDLTILSRSLINCFDLFLTWTSVNTKLSFQSKKQFKCTSSFLTFLFLFFFFILKLRIICLTHKLEGYFFLLFVLKCTFLIRFYTFFLLFLPEDCLNNSNILITCRPSTTTLFKCYKQLVGGQEPGQVWSLLGHIGENLFVELFKNNQNSETDQVRRFNSKIFVMKEEL